MAVLGVLEDRTAADGLPSADFSNAIRCTKFYKSRSGDRMFASLLRHPDVNHPYNATTEICETPQNLKSLALVDDSFGPEDDGAPFAGESMTGCVHISGEWGGSVLVDAPASHAQQAAEAMFAADPGSLTADEVSDALGELTNMVGGNIKGLLPAPSSLSLPSVAGGESYTLRVPGALLLARVLLRGPAGPVRISLWRS